LASGRAILGLGAGDGVSGPEHQMFGLPFPPAGARVEILEETVLALRRLFAGERWEGGRRVPAIAGPLLPPGRPALWIGGRSHAVLAAAARSADAWNGWAMDAASFAAAAEQLARLADGRAVEPTWGGIVLVGEDEADLERRRAERRAKGLAMDLWDGTVDAFRSFVSALSAAGCSWLIVFPAGGEGRIELVGSVFPR
jgi:alkanesulfonate monooxygenase SsuD/methylene tetrahydromethanopterin reductase-like flavin-dependent oxidoreductase (luciferase family)